MKQQMTTSIKFFILCLTALHLALYSCKKKVDTAPEDNTTNTTTTTGGTTSGTTSGVSNTNTLTLNTWQQVVNTTTNTYTVLAASSGTTSNSGTNTFSYYFAGSDYLSTNIFFNFYSPSGAPVTSGTYTTVDAVNTTTVNPMISGQVGIVHTGTGGFWSNPGSMVYVSSTGSVVTVKCSNVVVHGVSATNTTVVSANLSK